MDPIFVDGERIHILAGLIFVRDEYLTTMYEKYFSSLFDEPVMIGYFKFLEEPEPEEKWYYVLKVNRKGRRIIGCTRKNALMYLQHLYLYGTPKKKSRSEIEIEKIKRSQRREQKREDLIRKVRTIKKWGRGIIAQIAKDLGRTVGAVRSMLSVLTKEGILIRVRRGQYAVA
jgi:aromatic ring hydroxylase